MRNRLPDEVPVIDATDLDDETRHTPALVKNWLKIATTEPAKAGGTDSYGIWSIFSRSNRSLRHPVVFVLIRSLGYARNFACRLKCLQTSSTCQDPVVVNCA